LIYMKGRVGQVGLDWTRGGNRNWERSVNHWKRKSEFNKGWEKGDSKRKKEW